MTTAARTTRARKASAPVVVRDIPLKRVHDDILKANPKATITTKDMRRKLRATKDIPVLASHVRNASWVFASGAEYDAVRALFDAAYRAKIAKPAKAPKKAKAQAPVVAPVEPAQ